MRDIAAAAGMSLGAFYYYYPSKDSIVLDFYRQVQDEHRERVEAAAKSLKLRQRLGLLMHSKLEILSGSRDLMGALLRYTGNPGHPLSFLGSGTREIREESIAMFRDALAAERLPADMMEMLPLLLWAMHMGILLYFLYDKSNGQERTRRLTDGALDLTVRLVAVAKLAVFRPVRKALRKLLVEAELVAV